MMEAAYLLLFIYVLAYFVKGISYSSQDSTILRSRITKFLLFAVTWCAYVFVVCATGFIKETSLPPRMPLLLILPLFGIMGWFMFSKRSTQFLDRVPIHYPVFFQSFRVAVELLIYWAFLKGLAPKEASFEGYNFEIYFGAFALIVGFAVYHKKLNKRLLVIWNIIGLCFLAMIVGIFTTILYNPAIWGYDTAVVNPEMMTFPFMLIPSVFMPVAVFSHVFSIRQVTLDKLINS